MTKFLPALLIFCVVACNNNSEKQTEIKQGLSAAKDNDSSSASPDKKELLVKRGSYADGQFTAEAFSRFMIPAELTQDSSYYHHGNILLLTNKNTNRTYKIDLADPCSNDDAITIKNVTTSLHFRKPLFEVTTPDCSDWFVSEFVQLENDSLRKLFDISDTGPANLTRLNENTLAGTVKDRDEIVSNFQDYPVTVSLITYSVEETKPARQKIDFESEALGEIHGYRVINGAAKSQYLIKEGQKLIVDSLFRDTQKILLIINDSIRVVCPVSEAEGKLKGNAAG